MLMYNLLEYNSSYSEKTGCLWFFSKDKATQFNAELGNNAAFKPFEYKAKLLEETVAQPAPNNNNGILKNTTIVVSLKYLINFWRSLEMLLINYKVELKFNWTMHCILAVTGKDNPDANHDNIICTIKDTKLNVPVVTLLAKDNQKLSKLFSEGFERRMYWNEYKTKSENKNTTT